MAASSSAADEGGAVRLGIVEDGGPPELELGAEESKEDEAAGPALPGASATEADGDVFRFTPVAGWTLSCLADKDEAARWAKWGLGDTLSATKFSFSRRLTLPSGGGRADARKAALGSFLRDLIGDASVKAAVPLGGTPRSGYALPSGVTEVSFEELRATETTLSMFDRLEEDGVVRAPMWAPAGAAAEDEETAAGGSIVKQFDVVVDGVTCQDHLRDVLANPDTEHVGLFDEDTDERELLFRLFRNLVIGGSMCQWEDSVRPYLRATQRTYKDLVAVAKQPGTGELAVRSVAVDLTGVVAEGGKASLFPNADSPYNNAWVVIDPERRTVIVWYCPFVPFW